MFYAGPREASHHSIIRSNIGFNAFSVGRDHAGSENLYKPLEAVKFIQKNNKKFNISFFLQKVDTIVINVIMS